MSCSFCPRCGRLVTKSDLSDTENGYQLQCKHCDVDFYTIECLEVGAELSINGCCNMER